MLSVKEMQDLINSCNTSWEDQEIYIDLGEGGSREVRSVNAHEILIPLLCEILAELKQINRK
jgi:hypothetical protein